MLSLARPNPGPLLALIALFCLAACAVAQTQSPSATLQAPSANPTQDINSLTLDEALRLANAQASVYQSAILNEQIASEDVKQARAAFLPKVSAPLSYVY